MSRRGRALLFLLLALLAALGAAGVAERYGSSVARGYGPLREVVVVAASIGAGERIGPREVSSSLVVRRVPERFVPSDTFAVPAEAMGLVATAPLPVGSYLLGAQLRAPRLDRPRPGLGHGRRPVEITVSGADALFLAGGSAGGRVDVVVTTEPDGSGAGRTYIAAAGVPLLALRREAEGTGMAAATLGLTRRQALRLIDAESFARKLTLLPLG